MDRFDHSPWDRVLQRYVTPQGRVNYAALKAHPQDLKRYVAALATALPPADRASRLAFWINSYNALMVKCVVDHWPLGSVREIGGPGRPLAVFQELKFAVGGGSFTLDQIEHGILRKEFAEPRIHFVLVCASNGCPRLRREPYTPAKLEHQLEEGARFFVNEPRNLAIDLRTNTVTVSSIFTYYRADFERDGGTLLEFLKRYANRPNRQALDRLVRPQIKSFEYDWGVNSVHRNR